MPVCSSMDSKWMNGRGDLQDCGFNCSIWSMMSLLKAQARSWSYAWFQTFSVNVMVIGISWNLCASNQCSEMASEVTVGNMKWRFSFLTSHSVTVSAAGIHNSVLLNWTCLVKWAVVVLCVSVCLCVFLFLHLSPYHFAAADISLSCVPPWRKCTSEAQVNAPREGGPASWINDHDMQRSFASV